MVAENFDRLPKWAQRRIEQLEASVDYLKAQATIGHDESDTFVVQSLIDNDKPLGKRPTVRFFVRPDEGHWRNSIDVMLTRNGTLQVVGADGLRVLPRASNLIELELGR